MKKHLSVFGFFARSSFFKVLLILLVMCAVEFTFFHLCILAFLLSDYIISEKQGFLKCAIKSQVQVHKVQEKVQW